MTIADPNSTLFKNATVCDLTLPWTPDMIENRETALPRISASGVSFVSVTVGIDWMDLKGTVVHIEKVIAEIRANPECYLLVRNVEDIRRAKKQGKLGIGLHFQGTNPLSGRLDMVQPFYDLGVRHMLLCYNQKNLVGSGCHDATDEGLTEFGRQLIDEMNRVGMIIDCSHTGYRTSIDAMERSTKPTIFSHSNARALVDHERNIRDDQARACAATGGIVGLNGMGIYLGENDASNEAFYQHYAYYEDLVGPEHIALGIDFVFDPESFYRAIRETPNRFPGYPVPQEFFQPEQIPEFSELLLTRGRSEKDVLGVLGENFIRVAREVWT
jgi:membrane dipeptidase